MATGDVLAELADRKTLNSTKEDTAAILKTLGNSSGGTDDTVVEMLRELLTQPKVIKHIQRGAANAVNQSQIKVVLSGFSSINKMIVLLDGNSTDNERGAGLPYLSSLTISELVIGIPSQSVGSRNISYQVIEFC